MSPIIYIILAVAAVLVVAAVITTMARPHPGSDIRQKYTEGLDHLLRGELQPAYQCFKKVIDRDTDHLAAYLKLGEVMRRSGAADRALKLHESLLARPHLSRYDRLETYKNLALDYSALSQSRQAVEFGQDILKLDKRNTWAFRHLVKFYRDLGDWAAVEKTLAQWQKITDKEDRRLLALCRFRQGFDRRREDAPEEVRARYLQALKIDNRFAPAHYYLAESFADQAEDFRSRMAASESAPGGEAVRRQKELEQKISESLTQALAHWSSFVELSPADSCRVIPLVEEALFRLGRLNDVEPFLRQILNKDPDNIDVMASLANFYVRKGELDRAQQLLSNLPEGALDNPLIRTIHIKLRHRRNAEENLMPELDRLVDSLRLEAGMQLTRPDHDHSLMSWLEPDHDPLENLA